MPVRPVDVFAWLLAGLMLVSVRRPRDALRLARDWLPLLAFLLAYALARGASDTDVASAHYAVQVDFDRALAGGSLPTLWLQQALADPGVVRWYDWCAWATYVSYFVVPWAVLAVLWHGDRDRFRQLRNRIVTLVVLACAVYAAYPAVPPWLASNLGRIPPTERLLGPVWSAVGLEPARALFDTGGDVVNLVAAVPSLHAAVPALLAAWSWRAHRRIGVVAGFYALAMGFTLVYTGEHFVFDVLVGWALGAGVGLVSPHELASVLGERRRRFARG
ncbi:phosphatase PAP2 family protein [Patulibacter sp. NPDC049589]|uniref:phosphatase PAP2 family protein n=1 Tax=Patulibacter sp. NPDC049589 TaxID=3154731 RepID=UPI003423374F